MEDEIMEFDDFEEEEEVVEVKEKKTIKQQLTDCKLAKQRDRVRLEEIKLELLNNPQNADELKKEKKEIKKRQWKRRAVPIAIGGTAVVGAGILIAKASSKSSNEDDSEVDESPTEE